MSEGVSAASTPILTKESKKRELSSPEFDADNKKNRLLSDSVTESDISELEAENISHMEADKMSATGTDPTDSSSSSSSHLTLRDEDLQKIASYMKDSFHSQVVEITQASLQQTVTDIVNGVLAGLNTKIASLESENLHLRQRIQQLEESVDNAEQYSRRNCLRVTGVPECENENTDDLILNLARSIDVELTVQDIDRSHRLGRPTNGASPRPRDIIVKFISYRSRAKFYKNRVLTKGRGHRGVFINEHLTKSRGRLLYLARRLVKSRQLKSAWTSDGVVLVKHMDDSVHRLFRDTDLPAYVPLDELRRT